MRSNSLSASYSWQTSALRRLAKLALGGVADDVPGGAAWYIVFWVGCWLVACAPCAGTDTMEAPAVLPRYKFEVGKQFKYEGSDRFKYEKGEFQNEGRLEITVLGRNEDGSYRLLFSNVDVDIQKRTDAPDVKNETVYYGCADVNELGEITELWGSFGYRVEPTRIILRLPKTAEELANGWQSQKAQADGMLNYRKLSEGDDQHPVYEVIEDRPENEIYGFEFRDKAAFDVERGIFQQRDCWSKQTYGFNGEGTGAIKLVEVQQLDPKPCGELAADAERFFTAEQKFREALGPDNSTAESLDQAVETLKTVKAGLTTAEFQQQLDKKVEESEKSRDYYVKQIEERLEMVGQAAEDFATTDLDEQPHSLKAYRGKVVLLDFWYRGCGWCVRAMPQLKEVSEHFRDQPVVVLGMNTDKNVDDAKFVVEKLRLEYPNLKAEGLPEKFKVHGFPTMILIDQEGVIRDVHSGWSPTLKQDFIAKIDRLLEPTK
jgi:thiol-disulfide isomerase/thioredoxin